jgi:hypothetical protein
MFWLLELAHAIERITAGIEAEIGGKPGKAPAPADTPAEQAAKRKPGPSPVPGATVSDSARPWRPWAMWERFLPKRPPEPGSLDEAHAKLRER